MHFAAGPLVVICKQLIARCTLTDVRYDCCRDRVFQLRVSDDARHALSTISQFVKVQLATDHFHLTCKFTDLLFLCSGRVNRPHFMSCPSVCQCVCPVRALHENRIFF